MTGFDPAQGKVKNLDLVSATLVSDCPRTSEVSILMINQAIHVPTMENDLLCLMQMRLNDIDLHESPKFMEQRPNYRSHTLHSKQKTEKSLSSHLLFAKSHLISRPASLRRQNYSSVNDSISHPRNRSGTLNQSSIKSKKKPQLTPMARCTRQGTKRTGDTYPLSRCHVTKLGSSIFATPNAQLSFGTLSTQTFRMTTS